MARKARKTTAASAAPSEPPIAFSQKNEGGVAAVERALTILEATLAAGGEITLPELAERTGLYKSTILRLIISLEAFGYLRRLKSGEYQLGPKLFEMGTTYQKSFRLDAHVIPVLRDIVEETTESASFYIKDGNVRVVLFRIDSSHPVRDNVRQGERLPLDRGAGGRVLSRFKDGSRGAQDADGDDFVIATFGERHPDTAAIAAPVFGSGGELVGAIGVSGPRIRFADPAVEEMKKVVLQKAIELTERLGGSTHTFARASAAA